MIFGTHLALDNSDHVLDGGPNPPTEGVFYKTYHVTFRSATSALAELLLINAFACTGGLIAKVVWLGLGLAATGRHFIFIKSTG